METMDKRSIGKHIEPCPYCGGKGKVREGLLFWVKCEDCGAESMCCGSEAEAIERWNEVSTRNKTSQEIIKELKTNIVSLQRLGCSGAFFRWVLFSGKRCMQNVRRKIKYN